MPGVDIQGSLRCISGTALDAQGAANVWAGTAGLDLVGALNAKAGTSGLGLNGVAAELARQHGIDEPLDAQGAFDAIRESYMPSTTWAAAGGASPTLGGVYPVDTAGVAVNLGTSPNVLSAYKKTGIMVDARCRIKSGTSPASGEGYTTLNGLPVAPTYFGSGNDGGNMVGYGMLFDITNSGRLYPVRAVIDPAYSLTKPILFVADAAETVDKAGDQDATVWKPRSFATPLPIMHGGGSSYPVYTTLSPNPFDLAGGFILNLTLRYEAAS